MNPGCPHISPGEEAADKLIISGWCLNPLLSWEKLRGAVWTFWLIRAHSCRRRLEFLSSHLRGLHVKQPSEGRSRVLTKLEEVLVPFVTSQGVDLQRCFLIFWWAELKKNLNLNIFRRVHWRAADTCCCQRATVKSRKLYQAALKTPLYKVAEWTRMAKEVGNAIFTRRNLWMPLIVLWLTVI